MTYQKLLSIICRLSRILAGKLHIRQKHSLSQAKGVKPKMLKGGVKARPSGRVSGSWGDTPRPANQGTRPFSHTAFFFLPTSSNTHAALRRFFSPRVVRVGWSAGQKKRAKKIVPFSQLSIVAFRHDNWTTIQTSAPCIHLTRRLHHKNIYLPFLLSFADVQDAP